MSITFRYYPGIISYAYQSWRPPFSSSSSNIFRHYPSSIPYGSEAGGRPAHIYLPLYFDIVLTSRRTDPELEAALLRTILHHISTLFWHHVVRIPSWRPPCYYRQVEVDYTINPTTASAKDMAFYTARLLLNCLMRLEDTRKSDKFLPR